LGEPDALVDPLPAYEELRPSSKMRQRKWGAMVHRPIEDATLEAVRRSGSSSLPFGDESRVNRLAKKLSLDLRIRPRGRPRKSHEEQNK